MNSYWSVETILLLCFAFLVGGIVKGIIGTGLPTIALAILTATIGLKEGMAIIVLPSILTNIQQGLLGGHFREVLKRSWSFLLFTVVATWCGAAFIQSVDVYWLSSLLGIVLVCYGGFGFSGKRLTWPAKHEKILNPMVGVINGVLTGLTGSSVVPGVLYLQSIGLTKDVLIQTMGILFLLSSSTLALGLRKHGLFHQELAMLSLFSFLPAVIGVVLGTKIRKRLSEARFRKVFYSSMLILGCYIVGRSIL